jgi:hypothetical protein
MSTRMQIALATVLVVASASTALADSTKRKVTHRAPVTVSEGRNAAVAPGLSAAEQRQFERASNPNTNGF